MQRCVASILAWREKSAPPNTVWRSEKRLDAVFRYRNGGVGGSAVVGAHSWWPSFTVEFSGYQYSDGLDDYELRKCGSCWTESAQKDEKKLLSLHRRFYKMG
jgi:hypothetical protein